MRPAPHERFDGCRSFSLSASRKNELADSFNALDNFYNAILDKNHWSKMTSADLTQNREKIMQIRRRASAISSGILPYSDDLQSDFNKVLGELDIKKALTPNRSTSPLVPAGERAFTKVKTAHRALEATNNELASLVLDQQNNGIIHFGATHSAAAMDNAVSKCNNVNSLPPVNPIPQNK